MWRFLQRAIRYPINQTVRSAPQGCRDESETDSPTGPLVRCIKVDGTHHQHVLFIPRRGHHDTSGRKESGERHRGQESTDCDWDEWLRCFRRDFRYSAAHPYSVLEAVGWGTALLLGIHLSHYYNVWNRRCTRRSDEDGFNYWAYHLSQALPHTNYSLLTTKSFCIQNNVGAITSEIVTDDSSHVRKITDRDKYDQRLDELMKLPLLENTELQNLQFDTDKLTVKIFPTKPQTTSQSSPEPVDPLTEAMHNWEKLEIQYRNANISLAACHKLDHGNSAKALELWRKASSGGYGKASFNLGLSYELGHGVEADETKSVHFYDLAAQQGNGKAMYNLALLYLSGESGVKKDVDLASFLLEKAADLGMSKAQTELGVIYTEEPDRNISKAASLFQKAADQKDRSAVYYLGICYEQGWGVSQNLCKAAELYKQAADLGHPDAQHNLGVFFEQGLGGLPADKTAAAEWYEKAAKGGNTQAANVLAASNSSSPSPEVERLAQCISCQQLAGKFDTTKVPHRSSSSPTLSDYVRIRLQLQSGFTDSDIYSLEVSDLQSNDNKSRNNSFYIGEDADADWDDDDDDDDPVFIVGLSPDRFSTGWPVEKTQSQDYTLSGSFGTVPRKLRTTNSTHMGDVQSELSSLTSSSFDITFQETESNVGTLPKIGSPTNNPTPAESQLISCV